MALSLALLGLLALTEASERRFDVRDDIFAYPKYDVTFPQPTNTYLLSSQALALLSQNTTARRFDQDESDHSISGPQPDTTPIAYTYERMKGIGHEYLCSIPLLPDPTSLIEDEENDESEAGKDLAVIETNGWNLLEPLAQQPCLFYTTGWWSYSFCYGRHVKQYHALAPQQGGKIQWPPAEDPGVPGYFLGRIDSTATNTNDEDMPETTGSQKPMPSKSTDLPTRDIQTQSETTYLRQTFGNGTPCDLTGKPRRVEVQYFCGPGQPDRIGHIKETSTCQYSMTVYTSRLCADVAFMPPKEADVHNIECRRVFESHEAAEEVRNRILNAKRAGIDASEQDKNSEGNNGGEQKPVVLGSLTLGGHKYIPTNAAPITPGKIVMTQEEINAMNQQPNSPKYKNNAGNQEVELLVISQNGQIRQLSEADLRSLGLEPKEIDSLRQKMVEAADGKDWKIEQVSGGDAKRRKDGKEEVSLRGVVMEDGFGAAAGAGDDGEDGQKGSEERMKDEL